MSGLTLKMMNTWRLGVKEELNKISDSSNTKVIVVNPCDYFNFEEKKHQTELEVMNFDLAKVKNSDILIVNMDGLNTSIGTCIECYEAYKQGIPVLAFGSKELYKGLHPWIQNCITRHDEDYHRTVNYIRDLYLC